MSEPFRFLLITNKQNKRQNIHFVSGFEFFWFISDYSKTSLQWNLVEKFWKTYSDPVPRVMDTLILLILLLAPWADKINQIARRDWLRERARWSSRNYRLVPREKFPLNSNNRSFNDQAFSVKIAGYWPRSRFVTIWTSTPTWYASKHPEKNLANKDDYGLEILSWYTPKFSKL